MKSTVLIDFDGVIRHWSSIEIEKYAASLGLKRNPLFACAFSERHLQPAITGAISHEQWCDNVCFELSQEFGAATARDLVHKWRSLEAEIDHEFLNDIRSQLPNGRLVLATNATTRLNSDLDFIGLAGEFYDVINSSVIGVAKPDQRYFNLAMNKLGVSADECVFIDDTSKNVEAAKSLGIESLLHTSIQETLRFIADTCT